MKEENIIRGKKARTSGARFELRVRKDLESKGWIVDKWSNTVEFHNQEDVHDLPFTIGKLVQCKPKFNPFTKSLMMNSGGFPDFIIFREQTIKEKCSDCEYCKTYEVIGVEVKSNGYLNQIEKEKCKWYIDNNVFGKILIASKSKEKGGNVEYKEFELKGGKDDK